ncbi:MAG: transporter related protein [Alphaproteobacteria bacterium]|jgi:ABC-2 type transport system ATP-binding protein|nr:transporter related protein [Alphaproteobacteria bacterium]
MNTPYAVEIDGITKAYGGFKAVDNVSLKVNAGESFALIGPNGAGKSSIIKMLTTLSQPTSGSAKVAGFDIATQSSQVRLNIGYIPQLLCADGALTAWENLLLSARLYRIHPSEHKDRISEVLEAMNLADVAHQRVRGFSGGMIRRLEIAQSMLHRPKVIFMDEPTVGLDPAARNTVWKHVRRLQEEYKVTIILTTHYMAEVEELCGRLAILHRGKIVGEGTPAAIKSDLGPKGTLDDIFERLARNDDEEKSGKENYRDIGRNRRSLAKRG